VPADHLIGGMFLAVFGYPICRVTKNGVSVNGTGVTHTTHLLAFMSRPTKSRLPALQNPWVEPTRI
jgi:hypothetical protein